MHVSNRCHGGIPGQAHGSPWALIGLLATIALTLAIDATAQGPAERKRPAKATP